MLPVINHSWDLSEQAAIQLQKKLASKIIKKDQLDDIHLVAGVDVAYQEGSDRLVAGVAILDANTLEVVETAVSEDVAKFPYIPGLFSFRELPPLIKALSKICASPDLVVCDGQGIAHPRQFGLACHLGLLFDIPSIGCGKNQLIGRAEMPDKERGAIAPIVNHDKIVGNVLRTQNNVNPVYVSTGHRISLATACDWVLKLTTKYRLPETTRMADQLVRKVIKDSM